MEAETGLEVLGQSCVALLSDTLKLYFNTLRERVIGFKFGKGEVAIQNNQGFVAANKAALGEILNTDWADCAVRFDIIEQVVLARNRAQHGEYLSSLRVQHDKKTLQKHPEPIFANEDELRLWKEAGGDPDAFFTAPSLKITRDNLLAAIAEIERLADWIDGRLDKAWEWRGAQTVPCVPAAPLVKENERGINENQKILGRLRLRSRQQPDRLCSRSDQFACRNAGISMERRREV